MKAVLLKVCSGDEYFDNDCEIAVVVEAKYVVNNIRRRLKAARTIRVQGAYELTFWDSTPEYLTREEVAQMFGEAVAEAVDTQEVVTVEVTENQTNLITQKAQEHRTDADLMHLNAGKGSKSVHWSCYAKHTSVRLETAEMTVDDLTGELTKIEQPAPAEAPK